MSAPANRVSLRGATLLLGVLALAGPAPAQESASFRLHEHVFNAGGHPAGGTALQSPSFRVSLDSVGEILSHGGTAGPSFHVTAGFGDAYPPPAEVSGVRFENGSLLAWDPSPATGWYNVYRGSIEGLPAAGGACAAFGVQTADWTDGSNPTLRHGWFYLVAVVNRLRELGTTGTAADGTVRAAPDPCMAVCGNGVVEPGEECDDGGTAGGDGCSATCQLEPVCGNGVVESGEECDDGNTSGGDGCSASCQLEPVCGNGVVESGEECDDGNTSGGDGCSASCQLETFCGDAVCDPGESVCTCPGDCGSPPGETCDDGLDNDCDGDVDCADADCSDDPACV